MGCGSSWHRTCTIGCRTTTGWSPRPTGSTSSHFPGTSPTSSARSRTRCRSSSLGKYLGRMAEQAIVLAASGNHDLDGPGDDGEQVAGWLRRLAGHGRPWRRCLSRCRWSQVHRLPVVGRSGHAAPGRISAGRCVGGPTGSLGLALSRPAGRHGSLQGRSPRVPRPRARAAHRGVPAVRSLLRAHPPGPVGRRRIVVCPAGLDVGVQRGSPDRAGARHTSPSTPSRERPSGSGCSTSSGSAWTDPSSPRQGRAANQSGPPTPGGGPGCRGSGRPCPGVRPCRRTAA